ncbi:hypothetical protein [Micromonospora sp. NPDC005367]|uniref:virginiamycin B lyase family protein n=1 Tax=Micromonospora sp. NPDC005367 TaxID=3155590 RepID=UPI0033A7E089
MTDTVIQEFLVSEAGAGPYGVTTGPDGASWLTLVHAGAVARMSADGEVRTWSLGAPESRPLIITPGPDDALWFTRSGADRPDQHIG